MLQLDGSLEGVTPLTQSEDDATPEDEDQAVGDKLLDDDLELGLDQDLALEQQNHQQHQEQEQQQEQEQEIQKDYSINQDVE